MNDPVLRVPFSRSTLALLCVGVVFAFAGCGDEGTGESSSTSSGASASASATTSAPAEGAGSAGVGAAGGGTQTTGDGSSGGTGPGTSTTAADTGSTSTDATGGSAVDTTMGTAAGSGGAGGMPGTDAVVDSGAGGAGGGTATPDGVGGGDSVDVPDETDDMSADDTTTDDVAADDMSVDDMSTDDTSADDTVANGEMEWLPSWATTLQRTEDRNEPPPLGGKTLRQFIWPSYTGSEIRIQLSNERGNGPVEMTKVHIAHAMPLGQGQIDTATDTEFTFEGSPSVTIPQGERVWSDPLEFDFQEEQPMAVSIHFGDAPSDVTGHPGARTTSYVADGDVVSEASIAGETRERWYYLSMVDVMAPSDAYAVAVLGDSITDGYGVSDEFARWPDFLNIAINDDPMIADDVSVLNFGMGANSLTSGDADMDPGTQRFERDVLGRQDKIRWLIVLIGVNDLIYGNVQAGPITSAYQSIIDQSHEAGILVYGSPITPFASHTQGSPLNVRTEVNDWVTTSNAFDAVVDLATVVADPSNPEQLNPPLSNDGLHPNTTGYEAMGNAVDLSLFYQTMQ
jgi:lysophospholipase L1-like esterase